MKTDIIFVSTNRWKHEQLSLFFSNSSVKILLPPNFDTPEGQYLSRDSGSRMDYSIEIQSDDINEICYYKSKTAAEQLNHEVIVEDTGIYIDNFEGFPGPYSKYVLFKIGVKGILDLMKNISNRSCCIKSSLGYCTPTSTPRIFTSQLEGIITHEEMFDVNNPWRDLLGFSIFQPHGSDKTFGMLDPKKIMDFPNYPLKKNVELLKNWYFSKGQSSDIFSSSEF